MVPGAPDFFFIALVWRTISPFTSGRSQQLFGFGATDGFERLAIGFDVNEFAGLSITFNPSFSSWIE